MICEMMKLPKLIRGFILIIYLFLVCKLIISFIFLYNENRFLESYLFILPVISSTILWAIFYKKKIEPFLGRTGLWWDTITLVFGAMFGALFSEVLIKILLNAIDSRSALRITVSMLVVYWVAFSIVVFLRIIYGWIFMEPIQSEPSLSIT